MEGIFKKIASEKKPKQRIKQEGRDLKTEAAPNPKN
jgi:hypothetical protein